MEEEDEDKGNYNGSGEVDFESRVGELEEWRMKYHYLFPRIILTGIKW